jgi:hypothetical protein
MTVLVRVVRVSIVPGRYVNIYLLGGGMDGSSTGTVSREN